MKIRTVLYGLLLAGLLVFVPFAGHVFAQTTPIPVGTTPIPVGTTPSPTYTTTNGTTGYTNSSSIDTVFQFILNTINDYLVPLVFAIAFMAFLFGAFNFFILGPSRGNAESVKTGQQFMLWSIIGFFVMLAFWGIINLALGTFPFLTSNQPTLPTFTNTTAGGNTTTGGLTGTLDSLLGTSPTTYTNTGVPISNGILPGSATIVSPSVNNTCTSGYTFVSGSSPTYPTGYCVQNSAVNPYLGQGNGGAGQNQACLSNADCNGNLECNAGTNTCQQPTGLGQQGDECSSNDECQDPLVCDENSLTCQPPDNAGVSAIGDNTQNVQIGGHCDSSVECVGTNVECDPNTQTCQVDNGLGDQGDQCSSNGDCNGDLICDQNSGTCQPPDNAGVVETDTCDDGTVASSAGGCYECADGNTSDVSSNCLENGGYE